MGPLIGSAVVAIHKGFHRHKRDACDRTWNHRANETVLYLLATSGRAVFNDLNGAMLFNYILGLVVGGLLWFIAERRSRRNATQIVGPQRG